MIQKFFAKSCVCLISTPKAHRFLCVPNIAKTFVVQKIWSTREQIQLLCSLNMNDVCVWECICMFVWLLAVCLVCFDFWNAKKRGLEEVRNSKNCSLHRNANAWEIWSEYVGGYCGGNAGVWIFPKGRIINVGTLHRRRVYMCSTHDPNARDVLLANHELHMYISCFSIFVWVTKNIRKLQLITSDSSRKYVVGLNHFYHVVGRYVFVCL